MVKRGSGFANRTDCHTWNDSFLRGWNGGGWPTRRWNRSLSCSQDHFLVGPSRGNLSVERPRVKLLYGKSAPRYTCVVLRGAAISLVRRGTACYRILLLLTVLLIAAAASPARKKQASRPLGIISGTVFQANGRLLPGAKVVVAGIEKPKIKGEARTGRQGEFAIRVPAGGANYRVTASAKGFDRAQKTIEVYEHEKARVTFRLRPSRP